MRKRAALICFTQCGEQTMNEAAEYLKSAGYEVESAIKCKAHPQCIQESLSDWTKRCFTAAELLVFVGATGIAVRAIAPFVASKASDPAVLVIDEQGKYCISLLSGHLGGANAIAEELGIVIGAQPVITTATDLNRKWAVDIFAKKNGLFITDLKKAKEISAKVLRGEEILVKSCDGERCHFCRLAADGTVLSAGETKADGNVLSVRDKKESVCKSVATVCSDAVRSERKTEGDASGKTAEEKVDIVIASVSEYLLRGPLKQGFRDSCSTETNRDSGDDRDDHEALWLLPRNLVVGIGCRKGTTKERIQETLGEALEEFFHRVAEQRPNQMTKDALKETGSTLPGMFPTEKGGCEEGLTSLMRNWICGIASLDLKAEEPGLLQLAREWKVPFHTYSAEELLAVEGTFSSSAFVEQTTGVDNVCERSAKRYAEESSEDCKYGKVKKVLGKYAKQGVTIALYTKKWGVNFED